VKEALREIQGRRHHSVQEDDSVTVYHFVTST